MHLHNFSVPVSADEPHARLCESCGERQVYTPPVGQGEFPYVMMVKKDDLRALIGAWREGGSWPDLSIWEVCDRLELLLD